MGGPDTESNSTQTQSTSTLNDESMRDISSSGGVQAVEFSNVQSVDTPTVNINTDGLDGSDVTELIKTFGIGVENVIGTISKQADTAVGSIARVAESSTGATSELGATINKFALPAAILGGLYIIGKNGVFK